VPQGSAQQISQFAFSDRGLPDATASLAGDVVEEQLTSALKTYQSSRFYLERVNEQVESVKGFIQDALTMMQELEREQERITIELRQSKQEIDALQPLVDSAM